MGSSWIRDQTHVFCTGRQILYYWATKEAPQYSFLLVFMVSLHVRKASHYFICLLVCMCAKVASVVSDPMDCSPPGSSVHGILQARILDWAAVPSSRGSSWPRDWICISHIFCICRWVLYHQYHLGSPSSSLIINWNTFVLLFLFFLFIVFRALCVFLYSI